MAIDPIVTHPTTLNRMACRLQWYWSRDYRAIHTATAMEFGKAIHHALELHYAGIADPVTAFQEYMNSQLTIDGILDSNMALGTAMLHNYMKAYSAETFDVWYTEKEVARRVPVPPDDPNPPARAKKFYIGARVDAIVYDHSVSRLFVLEHKTFENFYPGNLPLDHQFVIEKFVAEGITKNEIAGVIYNGLRKRADVGKSKNVRLFERHTIYITEAQVNVMLHRVYWSLIQFTDPDLKIYPEPSPMKCQFCEFKQPCAEYQRGGDYQFLLDNQFEKREDDPEDEWE